MTPNDSPAANKTSGEVKRILRLTLPSPIRCGVYASVPREVLEKYVRMEEALSHYVQHVCGHDKKTDVCSCKPMRDALSFDPLADERA